MCHIVIGRLNVRGPALVKDSDTLVETVPSHGLLNAVYGYAIEYGFRPLLEPLHGAEVASGIVIQKAGRGVYTDAAGKGVTLPDLNLVMEDDLIVGVREMDASFISVSYSILKSSLEKLSICERVFTEILATTLNVINESASVEDYQDPEL